MEKNKLLYESPQLTVVEFKVERGYATSNLVMQAQQNIQSFVDAEMTIRVADQESHGEVVASVLGENQNQNEGGSNWQYSNGSWF